MDAAMSYATSLALVLATVAAADRRLQERLAELLESHRQTIEELALRFVLTESTPTAALDFERRLEACVRELARQVTEATYNAIEPEAPEQAPHDVKLQNAGY